MGRLVAQKKLMKLMEEHANGKKNTGFMSKFSSDDLDSQRKKEEVKELAMVLVKGWAEAFMPIKAEVPLFLDTYLKLQRDGTKFPDLIEEDRNYFTPPPVIPDELPGQPTTVIATAVSQQEPAGAQGVMPDLTEATEQAALLKEILQTVEPGSNVHDMDFVMEMVAAVRRAHGGIQANAEAVNDEATLMQVIRAVDVIDQAMELFSRLEASGPAAVASHQEAAIESHLNDYDNSQQQSFVESQLNDYDNSHPVQDLYAGQTNEPVRAPEADLMDLFAGVPVIPESNVPQYQPQQGSMPPAPAHQPMMPQQQSMMGMPQQQQQPMMGGMPPAPAQQPIMGMPQQPMMVMPPQPGPPVQQASADDLDLDLLGMPSAPATLPVPAPSRRGLLPPPPSSRPHRQAVVPPPAELQREDSFEAFFNGREEATPATVVAPVAPVARGLPPPMVRQLSRDDSFEDSTPTAEDDNRSLI